MLLKWEICLRGDAYRLRRPENWRLNEDSDSSDSRRAGGSRFQVLGHIDSEAALAGRCPGPGYHESPCDRKAVPNGHSLGKSDIFDH